MNNSLAEQFRQSFPILEETINGKPLVYFDNGATTQKPSAVIDAHNQFYSQQNANVHRAAHSLSAIATNKFEQTRKQVQQFINAEHGEEIIWTSGTTASINLVAKSWGENNLQQGDEIVLSIAEHHANIVPWQQVAQKTGAVIKYLDITTDGRISDEKIEQVIGERTKLVSITHCSNVTGKIAPVEKVIAKAKSVGALTLLDGAQVVAHQAVNVQTLGCDFYVFSAHKMFGPTGVGVLYGKKALLNAMPPVQFGGEMIKLVTKQDATFNSLPYKFEPGTPNIAGVIAYSEALSLVEKYLLANSKDAQSFDNQSAQSLHAYEKSLSQYCYQELRNLPQIEFVVEQCPDIGVFSFNVKGIHQQDVASFLDAQGIAIRAGHHCAMPLMQYLNIEGCVRVSLAPYNTYAEVDRLIKALTQLVAQDNEHDNFDNLSLNNENSAVAEIIEKFENVKGWDGRHREIMLLGKSLPRLDKEYRNDDTLISGCESKAWLQITQRQDGIVILKADSDARVVRGLLAIVLAAYDEKSVAEIRAFDIENYFTKLGLLQHLSPSRGNGLNAIIEKIINFSFN